MLHCSKRSQFLLFHSPFGLFLFLKNVSCKFWLSARHCRLAVNCIMPEMACFLLYQAASIEVLVLLVRNWGGFGFCCLRAKLAPLTCPIWFEWLFLAFKKHKTLEFWIPVKSQETGKSRAGQHWSFVTRCRHLACVEQQLPQLAGWGEAVPSAWLQPLLPNVCSCLASTLYYLPGSHRGLGVWCQILHGMQGTLLKKGRKHSHHLKIDFHHIG